MIMTLVAVLCSLSGNCHEEIITDQATFQGCAVHGEVGVAAWLEEHPEYKNWTLQRWKCVPGGYKKAQGA